MKKLGIMCLILAFCLTSWLHAVISTSVNYPASSGIDQPIPSFRSYENGYSYHEHIPPTYTSGMIYVTPIESTTPYSQGLTENLTRQQGTQWWGTGLYTLKVPADTDLSKPITRPLSGAKPTAVGSVNATPLKIYGPSQVIYRPAMTVSVPSETRDMPLKAPGETNDFYDARTANPAEITPPTIQLVPR